MEPQAPCRALWRKGPGDAEPGARRLRYVGAPPGNQRTRRRRV